MKKKGKLIVIDGSDGSGKATQTRLLVKKLRTAGKKVRTLDFPQYDDNFFGDFVHACLHGKYGDFVSIDPYVASVLYAADRFESSERIKEWLAAGDIVVLDRYVSANQIHQGGKIKNTVKRKRFMNWLDQMEYGVFKIPRPDITFYLDVPVRVSQGLLKDSGKELDDAENDVVYLENSRKSALTLARTGKWDKIACAPRNSMRSIQSIHEEILDVCVLRRIITRSMLK